MNLLPHRLPTRPFAWLKLSTIRAKFALSSPYANTVRQHPLTAPLPPRPETPPSEPDTERDLWLSHFTQTEGPARHLDPDDEY